MRDILRDMERSDARTDFPVRTTDRLLHELEVLWAEGRALRQEIDAWARVPEQLTRERRDTLRFGHL